MKYMNERKRFILQVIIAILISLTFLVFAINFLIMQKITEGLIALVITIILVIALITWLRKRYREIKAGIPQKDEREMKIISLAGLRSFLISIYWLLAISWYSDLGVEKFNLPQFRDISQAVSFGILGMAVFFGLSWLWYKRKENL